MNQVAELVDEAITLDREIAEKEERLKQLKADLVAIADGEPVSLRIPTDGGGWSLTLESERGVARVTQPGPKLKGSIDAEKPAGAKLMAKVGKWKEELFTPVLKYAPVANIRERLGELFKPAEARAILKSLTSESAPQVAFETKDTVKQG